jgi:hypothetical protein
MHDNVDRMENIPKILLKLINNKLLPTSPTTLQQTPPKHPIPLYLTCSPDSPTDSS